MSLDFGGKLEYPKENQQAKQEHAHTYIWGGNQTLDTDDDEMRDHIANH